MNERSRGIGFLVFFAFLLFAMPRLNLRLGPIPLYVMDVMAAMIVLRVQSAADVVPARYPFRLLLSVIGLLAILSELNSMVYGASILDSIYLAMRYSIAFALFFAIPQMLRSTADIEAVLKAVALATLITASLMILSSLPQTRLLIASTVFSINALEPADSAARAYATAGDVGLRGRSLVGVSILSATFVSVAWPLVAFLRAGPFRLNAFWSVICVSAIALAPMAIVMSYSRQALTGMVLIILSVVFLPAGKLRRSILLPIAYTVAVIAVIGAGSALFKFDRYINRFAATFDAPFENKNESARFLSYVEPFEHVLDYPQFLLIGEGNAITRTPYSQQELTDANHSVLGAGYYTHGLLSTLMLIFLIIAAFRYANWHRQRSGQKMVRGWPRALFLAYLPILPFAAFAPGLGSVPRAMYLLVFMLGLLASLRSNSFETHTPAEREVDEEPDRTAGGLPAQL